MVMMPASLSCCLGLQHSVERQLVLPGLVSARAPKAGARAGSLSAADEGFSSDELFSQSAKATPGAQLLSRLPPPASSPTARWAVVAKRPSLIVAAPNAST